MLRNDLMFTLNSPCFYILPHYPRLVFSDETEYEYSGSEEEEEDAGEQEGEPR